LVKGRALYWLAMSGLLIGISLAGCAPRLVNTPEPTAGAMLGPALPPATSLPSPTPRTVATLAPQPTSTSAPTQAPTSAPAQARPEPPKVGAVAYDFVLKDLSGQEVALSSFRGRKVMLNFWATWCGPCRYEIPFMVKLYGEMQGQDFEVLAVNLREDAAKVSAFVKENEMAFPVLLDPAAKVGGAYFVRGIPTSVFIDEQGIITAVHVGALTDELLREYVSALMQ
jgi:thiol-disulfide isomerase/thioredoxin